MGTWEIQAETKGCRGGVQGKREKEGGKGGGRGRGGGSSLASTLLQLEAHGTSVTGRERVDKEAGRKAADVR